MQEPGGSRIRSRFFPAAAKSALTKNKANRMQVPVRISNRQNARTFSSRPAASRKEASTSQTEAIIEGAMFPETDEISTIISDTMKVLFKRRLVDRVLQLWTEMAGDAEFPRRDQIKPARLGVDRENCVVIAVQSPVEFSFFVAVGNNLAVEYSPNNTLARVLLSHLPQVLSARRCLMIEGRALLRGIGVLYRSGLYPLSEDGVGIDHVLGAVSYRPLRENEERIAPLIRTKWL